MLIYLWSLYFAEETGEQDLRLPERLFATDRFPSRRLNVYSTLEYLVIVKNVLQGTPEHDRLMGSCFGKLYDLPIRRVLL